MAVGLLRATGSVPPWNRVRAEEIKTDIGEPALRRAAEPATRNSSAYGWECAVGPRVTLLREGATLIGRNVSTRGIQIDEPGISARHALAIAGGEGLQILDLRSSNGLTVGGKAVTRFRCPRRTAVAVGPVNVTLRPVPRPDGPLEPGDERALELPLRTVLDALASPEPLEKRLAGLLKIVGETWRLELAFALVGTGVSRLQETWPARAPAAVDQFLGRLAAQVARDRRMMRASCGDMAGARSAVGAPLQAGGKELGALVFLCSPDTPGRLFGSAGVEPLERLAALASLEVQNDSFTQRGALTEWPS